ncbi:MAG: tag [Bacteroidota bacterium]|nr:tag [Bacteroidota bacterium]
MGNVKEVCRCSWCVGKPLYEKYHDEEWGVPVWDDRKQFEFLVLESAQAGLSWWTVLQKRENYRKHFAQFDPAKVAKYSEKHIQKMLGDAGLIRNRAKLESAVHNAKLFLELQAKHGTFCNYIWSFVDGKPVVNKWKEMKQVPATTAVSESLAKDMKLKGFKFLGSTVLYAHMQATGLVNDHVQGCFRYSQCK